MNVTTVKDLVVERTEEQRYLREGVRDLVGKFGRKYFQDVVARGEKPHALWKALGDAGYLGVHISEENGGGGAGLAELAIVLEETAAQGCPVFMIVISPAICGSVLDKHGSPAQQAHWLPGIADGSKKMAFAITEPDAGSNTHKITTTATPTADGWSIKGQKYWTSGVDEADALLVVARGPVPDDKGRHPLSLFIVPIDAPGLSFQALDSALSMPEKQFMVFFDDVQINNDAVVGQEGSGLKQVFAALNPERIAAASVANGIARYAIERATRYALERSVWGVPIGTHQGVAHPLAKAHIELQQARLMAMRAAEIADEGGDAGDTANMAKYAAGEAAVGALDHAIQVHGGNGFSNEYGLSDLWFVARMFRTAPVSKEMILNHVAVHSLRLPKSY